MDDYVAGLGVTSTKIDGILNDYKALVDAETDINKIKDLYDELVAAVNAELALMAAKASAKQDLLDLAGDDYSSAVEALLDEAFDKIDAATTLAEVADILAEYLGKIETQQKIEKAQKDLTNALEDYISNVADPKDHLEAIIDSYKDYIDASNYLDVDDIIATVKEELLEAEKDYVKDLMDDYVAGLM